jgi:phosphoglycolate phosphatase
MKPFLLFDFDGVIADSFKLSHKTLQKLCPQVSAEQFSHLFDGNINSWEERVFTHSEYCQHHLDFFEHYVPRMKDEVSIFPGMKQVLEALAREYNLVIISSTISSPIAEFLQHNEIDSLFLKVYGNDVHKSKVEKISMVLREYGVGIERCLFITDTLGDMREAKISGIDAIGVSWGFQDHGRFIPAKPYAIADNPNEVKGIIDSYFASKKDGGIVDRALDWFRRFRLGNSTQA